MFRNILIVIAAISSTAAVSAPLAGLATLAAPAEIGRIVTDSGSWKCTASSCTGQADSVMSIAVAACTAVADRAGRVTAFTSGETAFGEAELKRCNRHVKA